MISHAFDHTTGLCYNLVPSESDWYNASAACKKQDGRLAAIHTQDVQDLLIRSIKRYPTLVDWNWWIGLYQPRPHTVNNYNWVDHRE